MKRPFKRSTRSAQSVPTQKRSRPARVAILALMIISLVWVEVRMVSETSAGSAPAYPLPYAGVNYYDPSQYFTGCPSYTYLQVSCWNNPAHAITPREQLISDLKFVSANHLVGTMSMTISLDQILVWNKQTGATGFQPGTLANVDDMLSLFHQYGVKALLILYVYEQPGADNEFKPEAIDGNHPQMEANYLQAEYQFIQHLGANPVDVEAAPIIDLQDEAYYQFEVYFKSPKNLGAYHQCLNTSGIVDTGCVDTKIAYPWLLKLYDTAKSASNKFLYTISDTHRLFEDYSYWIHMYPVDIIDEHVYDSKPWADVSMYEQAKHWGKPWFVGEAGCDSYSDCTYDPVQAAPVDQWWLQNLGKFGARTIFVEDKHTAWSYVPGGWNDPTPTQVGLELQSAEANIKPTPNPTSSDPAPTPTAQPTSTPTVAQCSDASSAQSFVDRFDKAHAGNVRTAYSSGHFNGAVGRKNLEIESFLAYSKPNALAIRVPHGGSAYLYRSFSKAHLGCRLQFQFVLGHGFSLAHNNYMVLAETRTGSAKNTSSGRVQLVLGSDGNLFLSYVDGYGHMQYLYASGSGLSIGTWYHIAVAETPGVTDGTLSLSVNGKQVVSAGHLDLGNSPVRYFSVGDEYTPHAANTGGLMYFDNISFTK